MQSRKMDRITEDIKRELTSILREMKDPRVHNSIISIVRVDVSKDLSTCKVYVSSVDGLDKANEAVQGLKSAAGYIRREVGSRLPLRYVPVMNFCSTDSIEYSANISKILNEMDLEEKKNGRSEENL